MQEETKFLCSGIRKTFILRLIGREDADFNYADLCLTRKKLDETCEEAR